MALNIHHPTASCPSCGRIVFVKTGTEAGLGFLAGCGRQLIEVDASNRSCTSASAAFLASSLQAQENETQESICQWSYDTFGHTANLRVASRANEELAEAVRAFVADPNSSNGPKEAADTIIVMCVLADHFGLKLEPFTAYNICRGGLTPGQLLADANIFMAHLIDCLMRNSDDVAAVQWIRGCYQKLCYFIRRMACEPDVLINEKMVINRERKWVKNDKGMRVRPEKESKPIELEKGWTRIGDFMGWPLAIPVSAPPTIHDIIPSVLNRESTHVLSVLVSPEAIEAAALTLVNAARNTNGLDSIPWNYSALSDDLREKFKRQAVQALYSAFAVHATSKKVFADAVCGQMDLDAVGIDSSGGMGKVSISK